MANDKTPLRDTAPATPERAQKSADRSTVARRRVIVGIGILVVLGVALFFLLGGKDSPLQAINPFHSEAPVPTFEFTHVTSGYEATVAGANKDAQNKTSDEVATQVADPVTSLFQAGYVDPSSWGDAGAIEDLFTDEAQKQIDANIGVLTLGADAGNTYTQRAAEHEQPACGRPDRREGRRAARAGRAGVHRDRDAHATAPTPRSPSRARCSSCRTATTGRSRRSV